MTASADGFDTVLVVDFGAQYAQLIARRVRECRVYSEIVPSSMPVEAMLAKRPKAIILSGGPSSVYAEGAPQVDPALFESGVPTFGICYGFQAMAQALGGEVRNTGLSEFGATQLSVAGDGGVLLAGLPASQQVWMSHGDAVFTAPAGFVTTAASDGAPVAAFEDVSRALAGVQFHPEVMHTAHGQAVLERFLLEIAGCRPTWTMVNIVDEQVDRVRECRVYSEIVPSSMPVEAMLAKRPKAIILSGGPSSVYAEGAPQVDASLFESGVPTFGICYGFQAMAQALGGEVRHTGLSEFGATQLTVAGDGGVLLAGLPASQQVWMSHGDAVFTAPAGFVTTAASDGAPVAA
ncbi:MAG TPA: glutamine-hydrolyzing GMP synthase, partial [Mycobacteriales bacterium]|nr:glutamine-hydrolyzing GMP synthase [Mycobacteriales bacterium]